MSCYRNSGNWRFSTEKSFYNTIMKWAEISQGLMIWDYNNNFAYRATPFPNLSYDILAGNIRLFADCKAQYLFSQGNGTYTENGEFDHLRSYLLSKLAWDPYMPEDEYYGYMKDFMEGFYGDGWEPVYEALTLMQDKYNNDLGVYDGPTDLSFGLKTSLSRLQDLMEEGKEA